MQYRRFGKTELELPVISCGGMRYQHKWTDVEPAEIPPENQANLEATIRRALELGIHHIETARGYGTSEMQLGRILPTLPREKILVQTKVAPSETPGEFLRTFERSMRYLGLDYVDLLALHGINNRELLEWSLRPGGCLEAARELQRQGRCRFVGFSTHATTDLILEAVNSGGFDYVNLHYYFVNELNRPAIDAASRLDLGVFIISPNDKGGMLYQPPRKLADLCHPLTPLQFNTLWCPAHQEVHPLSCGPARPTDFDEQIAALDYSQAHHESLPEIERRLRHQLLSTHGDDWCRRWFQGIPEYVDIPGEINVLEILRLWTYAKAFDLTEWARMRYNLLGQAEHWFPGQNAAVINTEALRPVLVHSPFADRIPDILRESHSLFFTAPKKRLSQEEG